MDTLPPKINQRGNENSVLHLNNFSLETFVNMAADAHTHSYVDKQIHTSAAAK